MATFDEWEAAQPARTRCHTCNHPRRDEVDELLRRGVAVQKIATWLLTEGHPIGEGALRSHFRARHHG